jgi:hypothetical protein
MKIYFGNKYTLEFQKIAKRNKNWKEKSEPIAIVRIFTI